MYHLIDHQFDSDMKFPNGACEDLRTGLNHHGLINFTDDEVKLELLLQLAAQHDFPSRGSAVRPFFSGSLSLGDCVQLANGRDRIYGDRGYKPTKQAICRIELFAMFRNGKFTENSFLDLSSASKWSLCFPPERWDQRMNDRDVAPSIAQLAPIQYNEIFLGVYNDWWMEYAYIVDGGNRLVLKQLISVNGHDVEYGMRHDDFLDEDEAISQQLSGGIPSKK